MDFLAEHKVRVVASLPCYSEKNVNMQRGKGVFGRSISGLQALNAAGYAGGNSDLVLDLVYNPLKGVLPPGSSSLFFFTYFKGLLAFDRFSCVLHRSK